MGQKWHPCNTMPNVAPFHPKVTPTGQALCTLWPDCNGWGCPRGRWSSLPWGCCRAHFGSRESASFWASPCSVWLSYHQDFGNCRIPNEKWYDLQISHAIYCIFKYFLFYLFTYSQTSYLQKFYLKISDHMFLSFLD